jgi:hypothetical protein
MDFSRFLTLKDFFFYYIAGTFWIADILYFIYIINRSFLNDFWNTGSNPLNAMIFEVIIIIIFPYAMGFALGPLSAVITREIRDKRECDDPIRLVTKPSSKFSWDETPEKEKDKEIKKFLTQVSGIDWVKDAKIETIDKGKTIKISTEKNSLSLKLNDKKTEVILKTDYIRTCKFKAKREGQVLNVYRKDKTLPKPAIENILREAYDTFGYSLRDNLWFYQIRAYVVDKGGKAGELAERAQYLANFTESLMLPFPIFCAIVTLNVIMDLHICGVLAVIVAGMFGGLLVWALFRRYIELRREWAMHVYREFLVITAKEKRGSKSLSSRRNNIIKLL